MEGDEDSGEDLTEYAVQFSIQESLNAERNPQRASPSHETRFVPVSDQNKKLVTAIREGLVFDLQNYVKYKYALDEADERGWFPLHEAAVQPIQQILEVILDASYKSMWEYKTCDGETPLTLAAKYGHLEHVRTLLAKGVWPNTMNRKGETPLLIAVRQKSHEMVSILIEYNCVINQPCVKRWSAMHEAAKRGCSDIVALLVKNGGNIQQKDGYGVTPLGVAAEYGHCDVLEYLIHKGVALKFLIPVTSKSAIRKSGLSPIHSAADGQNPQCLELLIENGFDVNVLLAEHISQSYDDERKTALYFAVSNNDILSTETLLQAGADPNKDPLNCLLVAVRANNHEIVRLLLSYGANVNCYFNLVNDTHFPSAIQYALNDEVMLRLLLNHGYNVDLCFDCMHGDIFGNSFLWPTTEEEILPGWTSCVIEDNPFCDFITLPWMKHLVGPIVRILIDYMDYVPLCTKLKFVLETQKEWPEIQQILEEKRPVFSPVFEFTESLLSMTQTVKSPGKVT
ncbi:hypothetical protein E2320_006028 [Naja naja]|nr:hypothetical protein E2320_006028 [Naja naja]